MVFISVRKTKCQLKEAEEAGEDAPNRNWSLGTWNVRLGEGKLGWVGWKAEERDFSVNRGKLDTGEGYYPF